MAKKKKRAAAKKKVEPKKNSGFWLVVSAIVLIIAGVILSFGAFITAPIPKGFGMEPGGRLALQLFCACLFNLSRRLKAV
jgi:hypothetical protein